MRIAADWPKYALIRYFVTKMTCCHFHSILVKDRSTGYQNSSGAHLSYEYSCYFQLMRWPVVFEAGWWRERLLVSPAYVILRMSYITYTCWPNIAHFSRSGHQEYKTHPEWYSFLTSWVDPCFCHFMYTKTPVIYLWHILVIILIRIAKLLQKTEETDLSCDLFNHNFDTNMFNFTLS